MAESQDWSSGESEPDVPSQNVTDFDYVNLHNTDYNAHQIFKNAKFHPSIKQLDGIFNINSSIEITGNRPLDCFGYFFDSSIFQLIIDETNCYAGQHNETESSHMKSWSPVTKEDLEIFFGLSILMGNIRNGNLKDYWSTDPLLHTPIFSQMMPRDRYMQILRFLHFHNNLEIVDHPLIKIKPVIDDLQRKFATALIPGKTLCIDESLLLWKGKLRFKQYIPLKRNRFGIKIFELVDCETGFILGFVVYTGANTDFEKFGLGFTGDIVAHFLQPYFDEGHVVYIDNWYTSPILAEFLYRHNTGLCGTVKANRKGMPKLENKLLRGEVQAAHNNIWMAIKWEDKRSVRMLTTVHDLDFCVTGKKDYQTNEDILKPTCVHDYNQNMGGVDNIDRQLSITETVHC
ncbi:piggyBac transposable element-derived protein 4-like [Prorops nasuta]|uniref:piggyBac transposable element-derived protein 4-like n=1 Tax=Prorops nasuta TaxID=863751 RepID=UPI0034CFC2AB